MGVVEMHSTCHSTSIFLYKIKFKKYIFPTDPNLFQHVTVNTLIIFFGLSRALEYINMTEVLCHPDLYVSKLYAY